jgi:prepilin-type N-terminal cleavage/methylation domain-containing protein
MTLRRGFSLVELMLVISLVGIIVALVAPELTKVGARSKLTLSAEHVAAFLEDVRRRAYNEGRCVRARVEAGTGNLVVERLKHGDCVTYIATDWTELTTMRIRQETGVSYTDAALTAPSADERIVFRPSGRLRGDNDKDVSDEEARITISLKGTTDQAWVTVTATGRICSGGPGVPPSFTSPKGCS